MIWQIKTLDELGFVARGKSKHRPRGDKKLYSGKYPLIQTGDIQKTDFYISEYTNTYNDVGLAQSKLWKKGTLCLSIVGANTAESAILGFDACFPDSVIGFIANPEMSNEIFIKYYFDTMKLQMRKISDGGARENLSMEKLFTFKIPTPPVIIQNKIASILSSYDELIENNKQRIKLLEEMAEEIYKEWFVRLRFPGYETTKIVDGLPGGWEKMRLDNVLETVKRKPKISTDKYLLEGKYPIIDQGDDFIGGYTNDESLVQFEPLPLLVFGDHTRRIKFVDYPFVSGADGTQLLSPKNKALLPIYFYISVKNIDLSNFHYARHFKFLKQEYILIPNNNTLLLFNNLTNPFFKEIQILKEKNQLLQETRDLLLPRLISGKLSVEHLIDKEEALGMVAEQRAEYK